MKTIKPIVATLGALTLSLFTNACASDDPPPEEEIPSCDGGKCDGLDLPETAIAATPCDGIMIDKSGRNAKKVAGRLNDPIANAVFKKGTSCPTTYKEILAKLREADKAKCPDTSQGLSTRLISETGQLTGQPSLMRGVVTRECGPRKEHELFFSLFGLRPNASSLPPNVEIIALDKSAGVFNYYEADGNGKINFFGNSKDMLKGPASGDVRRCANCHVEGGLVMKELDSPWLHWEGDADIPGAQSFVDKFKADLGTKSDGINMESLVITGNQIWNASKQKFNKTSITTQDLLRPLFCTSDINLGSATTSATVSRLPLNSFMNRRLAEQSVEGIPMFLFPEINPADYQAQIAANGQVIAGVSGKTDTIFPHTYVTPSEISADYIRQMVESRLIDEDLARDILMVDFTRPVFSKDRCDLLSKIPNIPVVNNSLSTPTMSAPDIIRAAIVQGLGAPATGTPAAELLVSIKNKADSSPSGAHNTRLRTFLKSCDALGSKKLVANALTVASANRTIARGLPILEFQETVVSDNLSVPAGTRLNPKTCELTTAFVPTL
jgi:hypothetical protein